MHTDTEPSHQPLPSPQENQPWPVPRAYVKHVGMKLSREL